MKKRGKFSMNRNISLGDQKQQNNQINQIIVSCKCQKSKCTQKYCTCYSGNNRCNATCQCINCQNQVIQNQQSNDQLQQNKTSILSTMVNNNIQECHLNNSKMQNKGYLELQKNIHTHRNTQAGKLNLNSNLNSQISLKLFNKIPKNNEVYDKDQVLIKREQAVLENRKQNRDKKRSQLRARNQMNNNKTHLLNIATLNVRSINSQIKQDQVFQTINKNLNNADILILTETRLKQLIKQQTFQFSQTQLSSCGGVLICSSNKRIKKTTYYRDSLVWSQLLIEDTPIHIIGVYLAPYNNDEVKKSINMLQYLVKERIFNNYKKSRIIIAGDFNFHIQKVAKFLLKYGILQVFKDDEPTHNKGNQLDQIFTNLDINDKNIKEMDKKITDHKALVAKLSIKIQEDDLKISDPPKFITQKAIRRAIWDDKVTHFLKYNEEIFNKPLCENESIEIEKKSKLKRWYSPPPRWYKYKGKGFSKTGQEKKSEEWTLLMKDIEYNFKNKNIKRCYELIKTASQLGKKNSILKALITEQGTIQDEQQIQDIVFQYYQKLYTQQKMSVAESQECSQLFATGQNKTLINTDNSTNINYANFANEKQEFFTAHDIEIAISDCNFQKGLGPDYFDGNLLKDKDIRSNFINFSVKALNENNFPSYFKQGRLILLTKSKSDVVTIDNTRPIVVQSHITKIIEKVIINKIKQIKSNLFKVSNYQTGFKEGKSTQMNLTKLLLSITESEKRKKTHKNFLFVDLSKAYDSIDRNILFQILQQRITNNFESYIVQLLQNLYSQNTIIFGEKQIIANKGVPQGSVLAPFLFNLYLDYALRSQQELNKLIIRNQLFAFADDILIKFDNEHHAKRIIDSLENMKTIFQLSLNKQKCQILSSKKNIIEKKQIENILISEKVKYLGMTISLSKQQIIKDAKTQIRKYLIQAKYRIKTKNMEIKNLLFQSFIRSLILYHLTPLRAANIISLEDVQNHEIYLKRQYLGYANNIKSKAIDNMTNFFKRDIIEIIQNNVVKIIKNIDQQTKLDFGQYQSRLQDNSKTQIETQKQQHLKKNNIYISKDLQDLMLSVTCGKTTIQYEHYHYCKVHKEIVDIKHAQECEELNCQFDINFFKQSVEQRKLKDMSKPQLTEVLVFYGWLWKNIKYLQEQNIWKITKIFNNQHTKKRYALIKKDINEKNDMMDISE